MKPQELTDLLYQSGALQQGSVTEVHVTENEAFNSHVQHLTVSYSSDAAPVLPSALVVKRNMPVDWARENGHREVAFYRLIGQDAELFPMIIPHFAAIYDEETEDSLLILQDLSATHQPPAVRPPQTQLEDVSFDTIAHRVVETLAAFHAAWWEHPQLGTYPLVLDDYFDEEEHFRAYCQGVEQNWQSCLAAEGGWLPQDVVRDLSEMIRLLPRAWERHFSQRFSARRQLTVMHGDAYLVNFLAPRAEGDGQVFMMDWQGPCASIGALDLVIMCASFWTSEQRHENKREENMLRRYLATLHAHGVTNYTWEQLLEDYRLMLMIFLQVAIWDQTNGSKRDYWWPKLQCLLGAARDFDSLSLLS